MGWRQGKWGGRGEGLGKVDEAGREEEGRPLPEQVGPLHIGQGDLRPPGVDDLRGQPPAPQLRLQREDGQEDAQRQTPSGVGRRPLAGPS